MSMALSERLAVALGREELGKMLTIWDELGWREKYVQAPMLAEHPRLLNEWLLAGTDEHGFAAGRKARRAEARGSHWKAFAKDGFGDELPWTAGVAVAATVRVANPFSRPFKGGRSDDAFEELGALALAWCAAGVAALPGIAIGSALGAGAGIGATVGAAVGLYAMRAEFAFGGARRRERFKRDSALGGFERMATLVASKAEAFAESHRIGRHAPSSSDLREALRRASLGMEPAEDDKERARIRGLALEVLAQEQALAEEKAKNALIGESLHEEEALLESVPKATAATRPRGGL